MSGLFSTFMIDITGGAVLDVDALLAAAVPSGASLVSSINSQLGGTTWQGGGSGTPAWGAIVGTLSSQTDLQTALNGKAASSHTHTLSQITDVTVTSDMVSIPKGIRPGLYNDLGTPPVGTIIESVNDGHLYWIHRDGSVHLLCDSGGYGTSTWGSISGTLSDQTDLQTELDGKQDHHSFLDSAVALWSVLPDMMLFSTSGSVLGAVNVPSYFRTVMGASDSATARASLGVTIGTHVQAYDADLQAIAGLTSAADTAVYYTGAGTAALMTVTTAARALLDDPNAAAMRTTLGLGIGSNVQAYNAMLQNIANVPQPYDQFLYYDNVGVATRTGISAAARSVLDDSTLDAMITTLGGVAYTGTGGLVRRDNPTFTSGLTLQSGIYYQETYGAVAQTRFRRAQGTVGSPTQTGAGQQIGIFGAQGWTSSGAWGSYMCYLAFVSAEAQTSSANGGYMEVFTTPTGATTVVSRGRIGANGNWGLGTFAADPTAMLDINSDIIRLRTAKTPSSASAAGNAGDICWDASYLYICTATNTWRRIPHSTW